MDVHYKTTSFYLVTSLLIFLKDRITCCAYYHFNEMIFPPLGGEEPVPEKWCEIIWNALTLTHLDPCTNQCELEVQKIIHLQGLVNQLPNAFIDAKKVMKSFSLIKNILVRIDVLEGQLNNESKACSKCGRP